jgi:predicted ATPase
VGPGGIGKTRLAVQAGREAFDAFPDGVWLVDLSALTTEALVVPSIGRVLEVTQRTGDDLEDAIVETIGARRLLLVLDNCEHVRNAVRSLLDEILRQCPYVHVLATSREALGLVAEHARDVPALATPPRDLAETDLLEACQSSEAVLLFVDRARAVRSDFRLTEQNASPVVGICRRLDGIPLAIELAAARTVVMSPAQLLARLEKSLDLLASRQAGIPDRHRTLRASIEWSYQLLPIPLREFFSRLSVFRGGWTLEAAESVLSGAAAIDGVDTVDALEQLASSSLVVADEHFDEIRFRMLETIREFAVSLVPAEPGSSLRAAHAEYFRSFVELADEQLAGHDQHVWLAKVAADLDNVRAAIEWSKSSGNVDLGLKVAASMGRFWLVRGFVAEGIAALRDALSRAPSGLAGDRAKALNWAGNLAIMAGDVEGGRAWHEESLRIRRETGDLPGIAASLHNLGGIAADQGDFALADRLFEECTAIATEIGDDLRLGMALVNRGRAANERGAYSQAFDLLEHGIELLEQCGHTYAVCVGLLCIADAQMCSGDIDRAEVSFNRCFALASEMGERMASGFCLCGLGSIARYRGTLEPARENCDRAVAIARELGAEDLRATGLAILGEVAMLEGKLDDANRLMRQALRIRSGRNLRSGIALSLEGLAHVSLAAGRHERAARFLGAAAALRSQIGVPVPAIDLAAIKDATSRIRVALGDEAFVSAHTTGAALPLNDLRADIID